MPPLTLLAPKGLWLLGLLAPLVVLYVLKIRRARKRVGSTWLWASAKRDLMARSPFKRFYLQLPFVLQALALVLLALAFSRPAFRGREIQGSHVAIVIDTSASMSAAGPGGERRIDAAKAAAKEIVLALSPGADAMVVEAGHSARLAVPLERDRVRLRAAIDGLSAGDVEGDLGAALALATDRLRQLEGARIVVVTDGALAKPAGLEAASLPVEVIRVGEPTGNAALTRVDVRSGRDAATGKEQVQGFVVASNFGKAPREVFVTLRQENASDVLASRRLLVAPGERTPVVLTFEPTPADYERGLVFEMEPHDAMPADDVAFGRVPAGDKLPVYLASAGEPSPWLERALASDPRVELRALPASALPAASSSVDESALVVVDGACPASPPGGPLVVVNPPPGLCFGVTVGASVERPAITSWEAGDPRMRFLTLDGVHVAKARLLEPESDTRALVRTTEGPIAADGSTAARTVTILGFDVGESDWPLKASYVLFVRNLLEQARALRAHGVTGPARTGEPLRVRVPEGAKELEVLGPSGEKVEASLRAGLAIVPDAARAGLYRFSWQGSRPGTLVLPANLTSEAESNLASEGLQVGAAGVPVTPAGEKPEGHRDATWVVALLALALVLADVWLFTRKPRTAPAAELLPRAPERRPA